MTEQSELERAMALIDKGSFQEAAVALSHRLQAQPRCPVSYNLLAVIAIKTGDLKSAEKLLKKLLSFAPNDANAYSNLGVVLRRTGRARKSLEIFLEALKLCPDSFAIEQNLAIAYHDIGELKSADYHYSRAIELNPESAISYQLRAEVLRELGELVDALTHLELAHSKAPRLPFLSGVKAGVKAALVDWKDYDKLASSIRDRVLSGAIPALPFDLLYLTDNLEIQRKGAEGWVNRKVNSYGRRKKQSKGGAKLKVGYFSADYRDHPSMHLMMDLLEKHDRAAFEVFAFSFGPKTEDVWRIRAENAVDHFVDVREMSDDDVIALVQKLGIEIAVDLQVFTKHQRFELFTKGLAPIQVNYLGYPGTSGSDAHDYIVADQVLIPEELREHYSEKIAHMPHSYQANCRNREIARRLSRGEIGLPDGKLVFCSFNQIYKLTPQIFSLWCKILDQTQVSILWIWVDHEIARENLLMEAAKRGLDPDRIIFANRLPVAEHLARLVHADLFLDTFPCNAHTTASDALRMGLPVLTRIGEAFASRVAASLLSAVGMNELITYSDEEYVAKAIELGNNPEKLRAVKAKLKANLPTAPLFDSERFTRDLERLYLEMHRCAVAGEAPDHIILD